MSDAEAPPEKPAIEFELVTLFPEIFDGLLGATLLGRAIGAGLVAAHRTSPRDFAPGRHRQVDDTPYGGGPGMIMRVEPLAAALEAVERQRGPSHRILLTPQGRVFDQRRARELALLPRLTLVCGRYEGVDERVGAYLCHEQLAIGDFVLAGGELAAAVVVEAVARLVPGVLGCGQSVEDESFAAGRLEYPQWTRPLDWNGHVVPDVLLSGNHEEIRRWRRLESVRRTLERRPDLALAWPLSPEERRLLDTARDPAVAGPSKGPGHGRT
jgi:tRNA (guanine37-N1)-methyltransferase